MNCESPDFIVDVRDAPDFEPLKQEDLGRGYHKHHHRHRSRCPIHRSSITSLKSSASTASVFSSASFAAPTSSTLSIWSVLASSHASSFASSVKVQSRAQSSSSAIHSERPSSSTFIPSSSRPNSASIVPTPVCYGGDFTRIEFGCENTSPVIGSLFFTPYPGGDPFAECPALCEPLGNAGGYWVLGCACSHVQTCHVYFPFGMGNER